jgi:hypothetical protein
MLLTAAGQENTGIEVHDTVRDDVRNLIPRLIPSQRPSLRTVFRYHTEAPFIDGRCALGSAYNRQTKQKRLILAFHQIGKSSEDRPRLMTIDEGWDD